MQIKFTFIFIATALLLGCQPLIIPKPSHMMRDRTKDYLAARIEKPLRVPSDLVKPEPFEPTTLPEGEGKANNTPEFIIPPEFEKLEEKA